MSSTATIVFARADLSIPGAAEPAGAEQEGRGAIERRFFELIGRSSPDVIVLDFSGALAAGADTIRAIRRKTDIPILVICNPAPSKMDEYRIAGAVECIAAPIDIIGLNQAIQQIMSATGHGRLLPHRAPQTAEARMQSQRA